MDSAILSSLGINEKAAKIYLAALSLGSASVAQIAQKTGIKRPTVYLYIDELLKRGLLEKVVVGKRQYYHATDPSTLIARLRKNMAELETALPELAALRATSTGKPQVVILEGEVGIERIYEEVVQAHSFCAWSNLVTVEKLFPHASLNIAEKIKERGIAVREIIADTKEARRIARSFLRIAGATYRMRVADGELIHNDNMLYGNVCAMFRLHEFNLFVVRIEDQTIADTMRVLFNLAWKAAQPLSTYSIKPPNGVEDRQGV
ncbi:MAG: hypothetical protein A3E05_01215 [Candidatus Jacksonbacteria bacterium RIFCSPHIGHO2_12_FULL_44_12]|nr:MAG: hypothetical protein A3E05_01215 [Candidatus Jacksonbacteria bacterium RIFCSPHIGHO2_12_FULL_44_12]